MKIFKWIFGLIAAIGGILAIMLIPGGGKRKRIKEIKKEIDQTEKNIESAEQENKAIKENLKSKKAAIKEMKNKGVYEPKKVSSDEAADFLKKYAKGKNGAKKTK